MNPENVAAYSRLADFHRATIEGMTAKRRLFGARAIFVLTALFAVFGSIGFAYAGFGITPPYVRNERLTRGSEYEQKIMLVRSDPAEDLKAEITMNTPGIEEWITIDKGKEFTLPKGQTQVPIVVSVKVPQDADYMQHRGSIRIRTSSNERPEGGGVSIALGAQIDVVLEVVDKIYDFVIRKIRMVDLEEGRRKWGLYFPGKIRFFMTVENTGNTKFGPTNVRFEIYDANRETLLEVTENTNKIEHIEPFAIKEVVAELPTRLTAGRYTAKYTIFKNEEIAQQGDVNLSIGPMGSVLGYEGYGLDGLSMADRAKLAAAVLIPLLLLGVLVYVLLKLRRSKAYVRSRPRF